LIADFSRSRRQLRGAPPLDSRTARACASRA
jgi:hypothetical protein